MAEITRYLGLNVVDHDRGHIGGCQSKDRELLGLTVGRLVSRLFELELFGGWRVWSNRAGRYIARCFTVASTSRKRAVFDC